MNSEDVILAIKDILEEDEIQVSSERDIESRLEADEQTAHNE